MADRRSGALIPIVLLAIIFLSPSPARPPVSPFDQRRIFEDVIAEEQRALSELQNSTYRSDRFDNAETIRLNLTGLEPDRGYSWEPLPVVQAKAQDWFQYGIGDDEEVLSRASSLEDIDAPFYTNVTGYVHGRWVRSTLETPVAPPNVNLSEYTPPNPFGGPSAPRPFERNITGDGGDIRIRLHERATQGAGALDVDAANATYMVVELTITDETTGSEHELRTYGVYFPTIGQAILTTTSGKYAGLWALPHLAPSVAMFEESRRILNQTISQAIQRQIEGETDRLTLFSSAVDAASDDVFKVPECEMVIYLQQLPTLPNEPASSTLLSFFERELRFPTGAFLPQAPPLRFAMTAFSPDCGFALESEGPPSYAAPDGNHLVGPKLEVLTVDARHHIMLFTVVLTLQLTFLYRQMREASTPSTRSRISFYAIAMISLGDGFTFMAFLLVGVFISGLLVNLITAAFLAFISVSFFGMRFLMDIWAVQAPEREAARREEFEEQRRQNERFMAALQRIREERAERARAATANRQEEVPPPPAATTTSTTGEQQQQQQQNTQPPAAVDQPTQPLADPPTPPPEGLPLPATAPRPTDTGAGPIFMPAEQMGLQTRLPGESFGSVYTRFYLLLLITLFVSLNAASWPSGPRRFYFTALALCYLSFWMPQIKRNVQRNCRKALNWEFVLGQSVLRMFPFVYFYGYKDNVLFAEQDYISLAILATWVWIQVVVLGSQELIGPRWFIKNDWAPPAYDYHPVLREDEEGATMPMGLLQDNTAPSSPVLGRLSGERRRSSIAEKEGRFKDKDKDTGRGSGRRMFDCAICMQTLEVPVIEADGSAGTVGSTLNGPLARRAYMVTPCRHIFHSACLEGWMKWRLSCPVCREQLPAL